MEKTLGPIPAFYACYLLRSIARHSSLYIGSTPHPPRRLRQHNGESKGGAVRTSKDSLRPWEMACLVTGFPSKIAALQFEWAWQNPDMTRHIDPESRITTSKVTSRISPRTGKLRKRAKRPSQSLTERLRNLHLLLRAKSFRRWPLSLTFYAEDVYKVWSKLAEQTTDKLRSSVRVALDESSRKPAKSNPSETVERLPSPAGIQALDVGYSSLKPYIEKSQQVFNGEQTPRCCICQSPTPRGGASTLLCPSHDCTAVSHLHCLSSAFTKKYGKEADVIVPTSGECPQCHDQLMWANLVRGLSLRMRGEKEIMAMFKPKRAKKGTGLITADSEAESSDAEEDDALNIVLEDEAEWHELRDSSDDDVGAKTMRSDSVPRRKPIALKRPATPYYKPVIEESDWESAEVLT